MKSGYSRDVKVSYYSPDNANPYFNWDPERMDSAAGWVLSASEIAMLIYDLVSKRETGQYSLLWHPSERRADYGRGLQLSPEPGTAYHLGS
ncbi:unnamed protein product, partial [Toxocara canis]|uniref:Cellulase n=1 Tax=Toxocara canis TaxID=6265 RepID=A0A183U6Z2_TOXCA